MPTHNTLGTRCEGAKVRHELRRCDGTKGGREEGTDGGVGRHTNERDTEVVAVGTERIKVGVAKEKAWRQCSRKCNFGANDFFTSLLF